MFGSSGISFAESSLVPNWSEDDVQKYLVENKIVDKPKQLYSNEISKSRNLDLKFCKYWAVANDIRKKFFEQYSGLKNWIDESIAFAEKNGYVVSPFGCIRRLPQLLNKGQGSRETKNLQNISLNSPVQNYEASLINSTLVYLNKKIKELNLKSRIAGSVHDSMIVYVHKSEIQTVIKIMKEKFEENIPENNGIPMELEFDSADYYGRNEVWGFGKSIKLEDM
ncbi:MAG: hypothetical protein JXM74_07880 [Fusobacteriaceae bacterium]|nr:hypothetical protein [Fusobacteriaceae bacterium]